jgi:hypothetical protein
MFHTCDLCINNCDFFAFFIKEEHTQATKRMQASKQVRQEQTSKHKQKKQASKQASKHSSVVNHPCFTTNSPHRSVSLCRGHGQTDWYPSIGLDGSSSTSHKDSSEANERRLHPPLYTLFYPVTNEETQKETSPSHNAAGAA